MKKLSLPILLLSITACTSQLTTIKEKNTAAESVELSRYGAIYTQLIQSNIHVEQKGKFIGKECKVNIKLGPVSDSQAFVKDIRILKGDTQLCDIAVNTVKEIGHFPLPENKAVQSKLLEINLTLAP